MARPHDAADELVEAAVELVGRRRARGRDTFRAPEGGRSAGSHGARGGGPSWLASAAHARVELAVRLR